MAERLLLISGVPAVGKSHFGRWLEAESDFIHIDVEREEGKERLKERGLASGWETLLKTGSSGLLAYSLSEEDGSFIWNWGFPPRFLPTVEALRARGFTLCWLDGDWNAARTAFEQRNSRSPDDQIPIECFNVQERAVRQAWPKIRSLFEGNIIPVLGPDGARLDPAEIFERIQWAGSR